MLPYGIKAADQGAAAIRARVYHTSHSMGALFNHALLLMWDSVAKPPAAGQEYALGSHNRRTTISRLHERNRRGEAASRLVWRMQRLSPEVEIQHADQFGVAEIRGARCWVRSSPRLEQHVCRGREQP
jgi:hypothetical protein